MIGQIRGFGRPRERSRSRGRAPVIGQICGFGRPRERSRSRGRSPVRDIRGFGRPRERSRSRGRAPVRDPVAVQRCERRPQRTSTSSELTAFPGLRALAPRRSQFTRGNAKPLTMIERQNAMESVVRDVYAESTLVSMEGKLRTIHRFLACWNLELLPYTPEVVYCLGAALKWRGYRSADIYLYLSKTVAERHGCVIDAITRRALTDVIRSCKRGIGPAKRCEGLVFEIMGDLPASQAAWCTGGPWRPRAALILGAWWMLREVEFSNAELRSVSFNRRLRSASWTLPTSKADVSALGETVTHGCCCRWDGNFRAPSPLCPYHLLLEHMKCQFRRYRSRFDSAGWALPGYPLFPDEHGDVCSKYGVTETIRCAAGHLGQALVDPGGLILHTGHA